ncbi:hypothetical protein LTR37_002739 [Vermiconidia calcicola]|uniref:Uncharacterized protein n=1 Tax=Vermiconidia calcicola TaxID=1690605 RepID=A0ACC3NRX2_9PEZI|nr:hypothetical protein LTR37_002739 [Vermiconidia calcicola]
MAAAVDKKQYEHLQSLYDAAEELPQSSLYQELVKIGLGDCTGKTIVDLGGGTGLHARNAIDRGAKSVDVVDISTAMLEAGKATERDLGRDDAVRWFVGDMTKSLDDVGLEKEYDITMVNWTFDHAETVTELETMWQNTAALTKKGGKLISVRMANPKATSSTGKYGGSFSDFEDIPGGLKYVYHAHITPTLSFPATTMSESLDFEKSKLIARRYAFTEFKKIPEEDTEVVKKDPEFWKMHVADPAFICITAIKLES